MGYDENNCDEKYYDEELSLVYEYEGRFEEYEDPADYINPNNFVKGTILA